MVSGVHPKDDILYKVSGNGSVASFNVISLPSGDNYMYNHLII